jgi:SAM-dependent methyltransferase
VEQKDKLQWIYSSRDNEELSARYDQWAKDYDTDLEDDFAWWGPEMAAGFFAGYVPKEAKVLDAGAGTGLVGVALAQKGYRDIVAIDLSKGMLEEADRKNVYCELRQMVMGEALDFPTDFFDAVISVGVLTLGHAPASSFDELLRVTRPGGHIVFSLRPDVYEEDGFKEKMAELENKDKWELVEVSEKKQVLPKGEPDVYHQVWIYRVSG